MFLVSLSAPRHDYKRNKRFDGKIGCWLLTETVPSKRDSKNRKKGTMVTQPIKSITKEIIRQTLINKLLPSIHEKFTRDFGEVHVQMDNCSTHLHDNDKEWKSIIEKMGMGMKVYIKKQPPKSPDLNVLDLGYFTSIQ